MRFKTLLMAALALVASASTAQAISGDGTLRDYRGTKIKYLHELPTRVRINATRLLEFRSDVYGDDGDRQEYPSVVAQIYPNGEIRYVGFGRPDLRVLQPDMLRYLRNTGICNTTSDYSPGKCLALEKRRSEDVYPYDVIAVSIATRRNPYNPEVIEVLQGMFITSYGRGRQSVWGLAKRLAEDERADSVIYTKETEVY